MASLGGALVEYLTTALFMSLAASVSFKEISMEIFFSVAEQF